MGKVKYSRNSLGKIIKSLYNYEDDQVIYAVARPTWNPSSEAVVCSMSEDLETTSKTNEMLYMIEVNIAKEVLEVWEKWRNGRTPSLEEKIEAIIYYAEHDAYLPLE